MAELLFSVYDLDGDGVVTFNDFTEVACGAAVEQL
jgi:Ca2+-binding EF-hand superfamily protein